MLLCGMGYHFLVICLMPKDGQTLSFATSSDLLSKEATNIVATLIVGKSAFFVCYCSGQDEWSSKDRRIRLSGWRYARISRGQA